MAERVVAEAEAAEEGRCRGRRRRSRRWGAAAEVEAAGGGGGGGVVFRLKFAPTVRFAFIVTVQVGPAPVQSPLQPRNVEPPSTRAVSVTWVPAA